MKLKYLWTVLLLAGIMVGCEEEEGLERQVIVEEVTKEVTEKLAEQPDLTLFAEVFKEVELNEEDVEEGVTIFAPNNQAIEKRNSGARKSKTDSTIAGGLSQDELKDHIVKGVIAAENLNDGDTLVTLSKKQLRVTAEGEDIRVNGVLLAGKNVSTHEKFTVHTVNEVIVATDPAGTQDSTDAPRPTAGKIEIKVWNSLHWEPNNPNGAPEPGATVSLYLTREDYANGAAALTAETDPEGIARFADIKSGTGYYVTAQKDDLSNLFYLEFNEETGLHSSLATDGLFQSQEEIDTHASQSGAMPGNFRWVDMNGDGMIDNSDRVVAPYQWAGVDTTETVQMDILIGYGNNFEMGPIRTGQAALDQLEQSYKALNFWHKHSVMIDGVLSDDANCDNIAQAWCAIDNFSLTPTDPLITLFWNSSYDLIGDLNKIIRDTPDLTFPEQEQTLAQAKGLRAYVYLKLLTYFGNIPMTTELQLEEDARQSDPSEVHAFVMNELTEAASILPDVWPDGKEYQITSFAARTLMAKAALQQKEYQTAIEQLEWIQQSGVFELAQDPFEPMNAEIIWDFSFNLNMEFSTYFYSRPFCPEARLTEIYLMLAEGRFTQNMLQDGLQYLDAVRSALGMNPATSEEDLYPTWQAAMSREGGRYANLIRWDMAADKLIDKGFNPHHTLLPIPQVVLDNFPNSVQNPGY